MTLTDHQRDALERMAGHDPRDPSLSWDDNLLLIQSAAQAAKDALSALTSTEAPAQRPQVARWLERARETQCCDAVINGLIGQAIEIIGAAPAQGERDSVWRCFHCDEVFTEPKAAANHFGVDHVGNETLCQMAQVDGGIARVIADLAEEIQRYRSEDNASYREFYALGADHRAALIKEEQKGYDRGLADARAEASPVPSTERGTEQHWTDGTCEDRRLIAAGYKVCSSDCDRAWHWHGPDRKWHDGYRSENAAVNAALKHLASPLPSTESKTP